MATQKVKVEVRKGKDGKPDIQRALKLFKNKVEESGHLKELRDRQQFLKPSVVKRKQTQQAKRENTWRIQIEREQI
jgi:small subunit ribosomal protein S21